MCSETHCLTLRTLISDTQRHSYELLIEWSEARSPDTKVSSTSKPAANLLTNHESDRLDEDASGPQDGSDIAIQEIGRQAGIFRNASRAIAWLHDVADLSCLNAMLRWFTLSLILFEPGSSDAKRRDEMKQKELQRIAHKPSGLLAPGQGFHRISHGLKLNPWFTSLWTFKKSVYAPTCSWHHPIGTPFQ